MRLSCRPTSRSMERKSAEREPVSRWGPCSASEGCEILYRPLYVCRPRGIPRPCRLAQALSSSVLRCLTLDWHHFPGLVLNRLTASVCRAVFSSPPGFDPIRVDGIRGGGVQIDGLGGAGGVDQNFQDALALFGPPAQYLVAGHALGVLGRGVPFQEHAIGDVSGGQGLRGGVGDALGKGRGDEEEQNGEGCQPDTEARIGFVSREPFSSCFAFVKPA